jgi:hypothetical protein
MFTDMRIDGLEGRNGDEPESLATDVLSWLYFSWVFQKEKPSRHVTKILQLEGDAEMGETGLQNLPILDRTSGSWRLSVCFQCLVRRGSSGEPSIKEPLFCYYVSCRMSSLHTKQ